MTSKMIEIFEDKRNPIDILIIILLAFAGIISTLLPEGNPVRMILGTIFLIFLPGYALVSSIWPEAGRKERITIENTQSVSIKEEPKPSHAGGEISDFERIILSIGLSLVILPIIGIVLDSKWSIDEGPLVICLFLFIIAFSLVAIGRRQMVPENSRFHISPVKMFRHGQGETTKLDKMLSIALVVSLLIAFSFTIYLMSTPKQDETFTTLYILDQDRSLENLPVNLTVNDTGRFFVGLTCHENDTTNYMLVIKILNETGMRENRTVSIENLTCDVDQKREIEETFQIAESGRYRLEILMFKNGEATYSQEVHLWIHVNEP